MKLLLDMNLSPALAAELRAAGFETEHWSGHCLPTAEDTEIMAYAKAHDYVVVTHDLDFSAILAATNGDKPSVVQIRAANLSSELLIGPLTLGLRRCAAELENGALLNDSDRPSALEAASVERAPWELRSGEFTPLWTDQEVLPFGAGKGYQTFRALYASSAKH